MIGYAKAVTPKMRYVGVFLAQNDRSTKEPDAYSKKFAHQGKPYILAQQK